MKGIKILTRQSIKKMGSLDAYTFKTQKQGDFSMKMSMMKAVFQKTAFAGFGWRVAMVVTATTVMPFVQEKLNAKIEQARQ